MVNLTKDLQPEKANNLMMVSEFEMVMFTKDAQFLNAWGPARPTVSGMVRFSNELQPENTLLPMEVTE